MKRRTFLKAVLGSSSTVAASALPRPAIGSGKFPERPITMLIAFPPGGSGDLFLRALAEVASKHLGQAIVPENRVGGTGTLAAATMAANAKADGYTIAQIPITVFRLPLMQKTTYNPLQDFSWIIHLTGFAIGVACLSDGPFKDWRGVIEFARAHPGQVTYGTSGPSSTPHLGMERIAAHDGVRFLHVPYKGGPDIQAAVLGNHIMLQADATNFRPLVDAGRFRVLNVWGRERFKIWPQVPTLKELGYPFAWESPYGLAAPRGLHPSVGTTLHDAFKAALYDPKVQEVLAKFDKPLIYADPAAYAELAKNIYDGEAASLKLVGLLKKE